MLRIILRATGLGMLVCISGAIGYAAMIALTGNFHAVVVGEVYRSAQPSASDIERAADAILRAAADRSGGDS